MEFDPPSVEHWFSYQTRVSLELPPGWKENVVGARHVVYGLVAPETEEPDLVVPPVFIVRVVEGLLDHPESYLELSRELLASEWTELEPEAHETIRVDDFDGVLDVFSYREDEVDARVTQLQVFVQLGQLCFGLTGVVGTEAREKYLPVFQDAVRSVRIIVPWPEVEEA